MEEDDLEREFEDDINNISDCDSEGGDFFAESIERLKKEILNPELSEDSNRKENEYEWNQLMESITFTSSLYHDVDVPNSDSKMLQRSIIIPSDFAKETKNDDRGEILSMSIEILDEVRDVLFAMIESVEYIDGIQFEKIEQTLLESDVYQLPEIIETSYALVAEFEEESVIEVVPDTSDIDSSTMLYDNLLRNEDIYRKHVQVHHLQMIII